MDGLQCKFPLMKKGFAILAAATIVLIGLAVHYRHFLLIHALATDGAPVLAAAGDEGPGVRWHDDYFTVQALDPQTFAIGEPRYEQQNYSYLIVGQTRAVLFDAGPGHRDIRPVVESLTHLPVTFVPSHFHYDHIGNEVTFDHVAVVDLAYLRERAVDDKLTLTFTEHLGVAEGFPLPTLEVDEWLQPGSTIDLGGRGVTVLYTPGHTEDSISLLDGESGQLFSGDFIYPGPLYAFLGNSGLGDYQQGAALVLSVAGTDTRIFGAHRVEAPGAPELQLSDVLDLQTALAAIRSGELRGSGFYPVSYPVNEKMELLAEPGFFQNWTPRHPDLTR